MKHCVIQIADEVNVKFLGLDVAIRRQLSNRFKYEIPGARFTPAARLGRWDGKVTFFNLSGTSYINLLPDIMPILEENGYECELDDQRNYATDFEFHSVNATSFSHKTWNSHHALAGQPITLRDHQVTVINKFLSNPQSIQEIPTGSGKTLITAVLSHSVQCHGRSLIIVPSKSLVTQTLVDYENLGLNVAVYFGDEKQLTGQHTICTWQSLNILIKTVRAQGHDPDQHDLFKNLVAVIVDETHQVKAAALKTMLSTVLSRVPIRWGLTGTVPKETHDQLSLTCGLGHVIDRLTANDLQNQGILAHCQVNILQLVDHKQFANYQTELKFLLEDPQRLQKIADLMTDIKDRGNTLILVDRVAAGQALADLIPEAVFLSGETKTKTRQEQYDEISETQDKVLVCTYGIASVGINIPRIFNLVLVEPGKSFIRVIQSIGRGLRKASDKDHVMIWDITSTCKFAKRHLTQRKAYYKEQKYRFDIRPVEYL